MIDLSAEQKGSTVLIIDDELLVRESLSLFLEDMGYNIIEAENGAEGIEQFKKHMPDIVLLDLRMPGMSGLEVLPELKKISDTVPVIIVSGNSQISDAVEALRIGAWDYLSKPIHDLDILQHRISTVLKQSSLLKENRKYQYHLEEMVETRTKDLNVSQQRLSEAIINTILVLTQTIEAKDKYTRGHCIRVAEYSIAMGKKLGLPEEELSNIQLGAILHDIGKIGIPGIILNKPGKLTEEEYEIIKEHPSIGENILKNVEYFKPLLSIIRHHHEWMNGDGYPNRLKEIPTSTAIVAVADVYDSLITDRPYRKAMDIDKALEILCEKKGTQFREDIVDLFINDKIYEIEHDEDLKIEFSFS